LIEDWWEIDGRLMEDWWEIGGRLVEDWWKIDGRLMENCSIPSISFNPFNLTQSLQSNSIPSI